MANLGKVMITPKGDFAEGVSYAALDLVTYNGGSYVSKKPTNGQLPTDTDYWQLVAEKGNTGAQGEVGAPGADGITPHIGDNGNWWLGDTDTGVPASGNLVPGDNVNITQNEDGSKTVSVPAVTDLKEATLIFTNVSVPAESWTSDTTYEAYPYKADIACEGVTADYKPDVTYDVPEATSGVFAPVATTGAGVVSIYASEIPADAIVIPTISCVKAVGV